MGLKTSASIMQLDPIFSEPSEPEEYLTIAEVAGRLKCSPKTVKNKMAAGMFLAGKHYFRPPGMTPRFKWSALVAWIEQKDEATTASGKGIIPMARGYALG